MKSIVPVIEAQTDPVKLEHTYTLKIPFGWLTTEPYWRFKLAWWIANLVWRAAVLEVKHGHEGIHAN